MHPPWDLGLTRLEVPSGDRGRRAGFGYLHKTAPLGHPWSHPLVHPFRDSPPRNQLPTILLEPLVSGNLVNRFLFCPAPMPAHHALFIVQGPPCPTVVERTCGSAALKRAVGGFRSNQIPLLPSRHGTGGAPSSKYTILALFRLVSTVEVGRGGSGSVMPISLFSSPHCSGGRHVLLFHCHCQRSSCGHVLR